MEILFIKTSSMGDVLHHMPAVTDARRQFPQAHIGWVVEEAFAGLAQMHPGVNEVFPVAVRRWRGRLWLPETWREIGAFRRKLRARRYDAVIDTQGLCKTGAIAWLAEGRRHGYDAASVRENLAARFYDVHHSVPRKMHAIERNRMLTGLALGYASEGPPDFGIARTRKPAARSPCRAVFLHATARREKEWPEARWIEAGKSVASRGFEILLPWGNAAERTRSERLAAAIPGAVVPELMPLSALGELMAGAEFVLGVDTGLLHLAAALEVPLVAVLAHPKSLPTTPMGRGPVEIVGSGREIVDAGSVLSAIERILMVRPSAG
jgi:heptosyltransferase-1